VVADYNDDDWLNAVLTYDSQQAALVLTLRSKGKALRLFEIQGFATDVEAFGLSLPDGFRLMQFGEGADIPEAMKSDVEHMNRLNFRWGCDIAIPAGSEVTVLLPAAGPGKERGVLTLAYEYPKLFGLVKGKNGMYARLTSKRDAVGQA
jgi:hypothetical protein